MRAQLLMLLTVCLTCVLAALYVVHPRLLSRPSLAWLGGKAAAGRSIAELVRAVGDEHAELAAAARKALLEEISATRLEATPQAAARLIELADELAEHCPSWHESTRADNAALATRLLSVTGDHFPVDTRDTIVARCEIILRAAHATHLVQAEAVTKESSAAAISVPADAALRERPIAEVSFDAPLAQFPGGGLPIERAGPALPATSSKATPPSRLAGEGPGVKGSATTNLATTMPNAASGGTAEDGDAPLRLTAPSEQLREMPRFQRDAATRRPNKLAVAAAVVAVQSASQGSSRPTSPVIEMAQRLHSPVDTSRVEARAELRAIGYSEAHVDLLRSVTDADAVKRAAAARALPVMRGMNARPWLLWLSYDDTEEVRHAALSVLATSHDPELLDRMREAVDADAAPRVRRLAETYLTNMSQR